MKNFLLKILQIFGFVEQPQAPVGPLTRGLKKISVLKQMKQEANKIAMKKFLHEAPYLVEGQTPVSRIHTSNKTNLGVPNGVERILESLQHEPLTHTNLRREYPPFPDGRLKV